MSLFRESEKKKRSRLERWARDVERAVAKRTRKLDLRLETLTVSPDSEPATLSKFHDAFGPDADYGVAVTGESEGCRFVAMLPFRGHGMVVRFGIPTQVQAVFANTSGRYSMGGGGAWVCEPKNRKRARQMNRRFPEPVVQRFTGTAIERVERGGHLGPDGEEGSELCLYGLPGGQDPIDEFADAMRRVRDIAQLLEEWNMPG